jgi:hypothetical protein
MSYMKIPKTFRLSEEAVAILDKQSNATEFLEDLIASKPQTVSYGESLILDKLANLPSKPTAPELQPIELPCCKLKNPCRHWSYNGVDQTWTNSLTGEIKEL